MSGTVQLRSPRQATQVFVQSGFPKQRHTFVVEFVRSAASINYNPANLTFVVKSSERPSITPHTEELNQYNKKRQIYTGYKTNPVRISFYDTADGVAQRMWNEYSKYYFGDFSQVPYSFVYDATMPQFGDLTGAGFGFTGGNGGSSNPEDQFYFKQINIMHFYSGTYDVYALINPRIAAFEMDDLDYANAEVATINTQIVYEAALQYINAPSTGLFPPVQSLPEFQPGANFDGFGLDIPALDNVGPYPVPGSPNAVSSSNTIQNILNMLVPQGTPLTPNSQYFNSSLGGGLGVFGNFLFGANPATAVNSAGGASNLAYLATGNPALAAVLNLGSTASPLSVPTASTGINGPLYNTVSGSVVSSGSGTAGDTVTQGVMAAALTGAPINPSSDAGATLSPAAYGAINASQPASAQYGFNAGSIDSAYQYNLSQTAPTALPYAPYTQVNIAQSGDAGSPTTVPQTGGDATYVPGDTGYSAPNSADPSAPDFENV